MSSSSAINADSSDVRTDDAAEQVLLVLVALGGAENELVRTFGRPCCGRPDNERPCHVKALSRFFDGIWLLVPMCSDTCVHLVRRAVGQLNAAVGRGTDRRDRPSRSPPASRPFVSGCASRR